MSESGRQTIKTDRAPKAVGPYSQAVQHGTFVFTSGQVPLDPATGMLATGSIDAQTRRVFENLGAVLEASGASFSDVVKTTVFLADLADFAAMNAVYASYFPSDP